MLPYFTDTEPWMTYLGGFVVFSVFWEGVCKYKARKQVRSVVEGGVPNPFMTLRPVNYYRLRYLWPGAFLVPIRFVGIASLLMFVSACGFIVGAGRSAAEKQSRPLTGWRKHLMAVSSKIAARGVLACVGFYHIQVIGKPDPTAKIIIGNHRGPFEAIYLMAEHNCCMVSAIENRFPMVKHAMDGLQFIFVERSNKKDKNSVIDVIKSRASQPGWPAVAMFPEGTTTNGKALINFKRGAFMPGVPVQPVAFEFPNSDVDIDPSWVFGVRGPLFGLSTIVLRLMSSWHNPMRVTYLPLAVPSEMEKLDPQMFADRVRKDMGAVLKIPCTEHEQEDVVLAMDAFKRNLHPSEGVVEFGKLKRLFHLTLPEAKQMLEDFKKVDADGNGEITVAEVGELLGLSTDGEIIQGLFSVLNEGRGDTIHFKEFVMGMAKASSRLDAAEWTSLCFDAFDITHDGIIEKSELATMLKLGFSHITPAQIDNLYNLMSASGPITKENFTKFLEENPRYLYIFDLLREQSAPDDEKIIPLVSSKQKNSFIRHRTNLMHGKPDEVVE
eukprot:TRINITY_DN2405_c0_g1_i1.p1 TRINITY_DN2405_c0_g1~~TRINITY_DN2405_c0_g1_i1.p1  ORF type:complete len:553 (+),score=136.43 TRINITY_DN2405_c0_g1_i1:88-1746(+)